MRNPELREAIEGLYHDIDHHVSNGIVTQEIVDDIKSLITKQMTNLLDRVESEVIGGDSRADTVKSFKVNAMKTKQRRILKAIRKEMKDE